MNQITIYNKLTKHLSNTEAHGVAREIWDEVVLHTKEEVSRAKKAAQEMGENEISARVQKFLENPLMPEDEARYLRAHLHAGLAAGEVNPQILEKIDKIIGINSGEDEHIVVVDFKEAFPDMEEAIRICHAPAEGHAKEWLEKQGKTVIDQ